MSEENEVEMNSDSELSDVADYDAEILEIKKLLLDDPKNVAKINELLSLWHKNGDFEELEEGRKKYSQIVALSFENWSDWIKQKREEKEQCALITVDDIEKLFDQAVLDVNSHKMWMERIYFGASEDIEMMRQKAEQALSAVGNRFDVGGLVWSLYIQYEKANIASFITEEQPKAAEHLLQLYKRAVRSANQNSEQLLKEAQEFYEALGQDTAELSAIYYSKQELIQKLDKIEDEIQKDMSAGLKEYLDFELAGGDMARIQMAHERIVGECADDEVAWSVYGMWCAQKLKVPSVATQVYKRAIRHCPYSCILYQDAILAFERSHEPVEDIDELWNYAKDALIDNPDNGRALYRTYIYHRKRRIAASGSSNFEQVAEVFEQGHDTLKLWFSESFDPRGEYRQNMAYFYASVMKNMTRTRDLWTDIMASGFGKSAAKWLEAVRIEREFGNNEEARRYLNKALNSVSDNIQDIYEYYVQFEREVGTLEQLDAVLEKVNAQAAHRAARPQKKVPERREVGKRAYGEDKPMVKKQKTGENSFKAPAPAAKKPQKPASGDEEAQRTVFVSNLDYGTTEDHIRAVVEGVETVRFAARPKGPLHRGFGYLVLSNVEFAQKALKNDRVLVNGRPMFVSTNDPEKRVGFKYSTGLEKNKVFVKHIHLKATEEEIKALFAQFGPIESVRLARHKSGQLKGVAYVDFESEAAAENCLKAEKIVLKEKELLVALSNPPKKGQPREPDVDTDALAAGMRKAHLQLVPRASALQKKVEPVKKEVKKEEEMDTDSDKPKSNDFFKQLMNKK